MTSPIRILHLEDDPADRELVHASLSSAGIECEITCVQTRDDFEGALRETEFDLILGDYQLPQYDGMSALKASKDMRPNVPFIFVSGAIGEDAAIEGLTQGATDYVLKQRLGRLAPAIKRVLHEAESEKERQRAIAERQQAEAVRDHLAAIVQSSHDAIIGVDLNANISSWNMGAAALYGYGAQEVIGQPMSILAPDNLKAEITDIMGRIAKGEGVPNFETERLRKNGEQIDVALDVSPIRNSSGEIIGASTIARNITAQKKAERALHKVNRALKVLSSCNMALVHATDEIQLMSEMCRIIVEGAQYRRAWVGFVSDADTMTITPVAQSGAGPEVMGPEGTGWAAEARDTGPLGLSLRSGALQIVQNIAADERFETWKKKVTGLGCGSAVIAPLAHGSQLFGALSIYAAGINAFDEGELEQINELAADMAYGIQMLRMRAAHDRSAHRLMSTLESAVQAIAGTVEMRDPYTAGHQRRVAQLATQIGKEMGLPDDRIHGIHLASVVHDLGKINIPSELLSKPTRLTALEYQLIKTHSQSGYEILKGIDFPWPIAEIVYQHHERPDGSGYPRGLKEEQLLLEAMIVSVADVVDAMASHRPYRPALGIDVALDEINKNRGTLYSGNAVDACLRVFREKGFQFT